MISSIVPAALKGQIRVKVDNLPEVTQKQGRGLHSACLEHYLLSQCFLRKVHAGKVGTIY